MSVNTHNPEKHRLDWEWTVSNTFKNAAYSFAVMMLLAVVICPTSLASIHSGANLAQIKDHLSISQDSPFVTVGNLSLSGYRSLVAQDDVAFLALYQEPGGVIAVNTTDTENLVTLDFYATPSHVDNLVLKEDRLYVMDRGNGLFILNVTDPSHMVLLSQYSDYPWISDICIADDKLAYVGTQDGLVTLNVSGTAPVLLGSYGVWLEIDSLQVQDGIVYALHDGGLVVIDASNPAQPHSIATYVIPSCRGEIHLVDDVAILALEYSGVMVLDISNPYAPSLLAVHDQYNSYASIIDGNILFLGRYRSISAFNIANAPDIHFLGVCSDIQRPYWMDYNNGYLFVSSMDEGLWVLEHDLDSDMLYSRTEYEIGTPHDNGDADSDSISDGLEVLVYGTNPLSSDSDSDSLPDLWEILNGMNPLLNDSWIDADGDLLTALEEYLAGTNIYDVDSDNDLISDFDELRVYFTNPCHPDSDLDALPDLWEIQHGLDPLVNDASEDADNDLLSNLLEYQIGTDPQLRDTDHDGYLDSWEYFNGFDPLDPSVTPQQFLVSISGWTILTGTFAFCGLVIYRFRMKITSHVRGLNEEEHEPSTLDL